MGNSMSRHTTERNYGRNQLTNLVGRAGKLLLKNIRCRRCRRDAVMTMNAKVGCHDVRAGCTTEFGDAGIRTRRTQAYQVQVHLNTPPETYCSIQLLPT